MARSAQHDVRHPYLDGPFPRAFAHRGWHLGELTGLENSTAAFTHAVAEGYRYLETDVRASRDGVVVVLHDPTLDRTTDGRGPVQDVPWDRLRSVRIGGREPVARLEELLEAVPGALLNIDVKADDAVGPVLRVLERSGAWPRVCLASFSDRRLRRLRAAAGPRLLTSMGPRSAVSLRLGSVLPAGWPVPPVRGDLAQLPVRYGWLPVVDRALVGAAHRLGREVHAWTVDWAADMTALLDLGVDGLVTDRPDVLREVLRERGQW